MNQDTARALTKSYLANLKTDSERELKDAATDYVTQYHALHHIRSLVGKMPDLVDSRLITSLRDVLLDTRFLHQRQSLFFYRIAAEALSSIVVYSRERSLVERTFAVLQNILATASGNSHRATAEAMGLLPCTLCGPELDTDISGPIPRLTWQQALSSTGINLKNAAVFYGRSIAAPIQGNGHLLVFKLARGEEPLKDLMCEAQWMTYLRAQRHLFPLRFNVPKVIKFKATHLIRLSQLPDHCGLRSGSYAIGFVAHRQYFQYPNDLRAGPGEDNSLFNKIIGRNAWLLGKLASMGILHTSPIALFHNRIQAHRRRDRGLYEWYRAGRLDRWLESCLYPNIGTTGVRDFEHFISIKGANRQLYRLIGNHFLSLLLIVGSYFRNHAPQKVGFTARGKPVDVRYLFDQRTLTDIIGGIFQQYYAGFVGASFTGKIPLNIDDLCGRMTEEMGVDRYMEEIFRVADQKDMTDDAFKFFLRQRGYADEEIKPLQKGHHDILIRSGPHLGGFNEQISLPELIEAVATMSALCISGRFRKQRH